MGRANHPDLLNQLGPPHPVVALGQLTSPTTWQWSLASRDFHHPTPVPVLPGRTLTFDFDLQPGPRMALNQREKKLKLCKTSRDACGLTAVSFTVVNDLGRVSRRWSGATQKRPPTLWVQALGAVVGRGGEKANWGQVFDPAMDRWVHPLHEDPRADR